MTRKQINSLRRKARLAAVMGAAIYLAAGVKGLGEDETARANVVAEPVQTVRSVDEATKSVDEAEEPVDEEEQRIITYVSETLDAYDCYLLTKIAMAEAGNQDVEGKALVMLVVLNRAWGDNGFPNTVEEVIYQNRQFSPVLEGKFEDVIPSEECWEALEMVMQGWDESQGALYFESKSSSTWHQENLKFLFKHQDHYFYAEKEENA